MYMPNLFPVLRDMNYTEEKINSENSFKFKIPSEFKNPDKNG